MDRDLEETAATYLEEFTVDGVLEESPEEQAEQSGNTIDLEASLRDADTSPVVSLVDRILLQAMSVGASDIHVEPQQKGLRLRYRQDGVLQQYIEPLPGRLIPAVTSRFKILADLDIAERRQAQDGRIRRKYRDRVIDFRVNTLPSRYGEKVVLRLLDSDSTQLGLDQLISDPITLDLVRELGSKPFGMILVTGPTGSGKSTTLYSLLAERNDPGINISTVEDPIEFVYQSDKSLVHQRQLNEDTRSFANALRAALREDPDVILVGEMRDLETIQLAISAAETGHLVFGTLHTSSAAQTVDRMVDVFPPGQQTQIRVQLSGSLVAVFSQTLCRRQNPAPGQFGRVMAQEIMINTPATANLIREGKTAQLYSQIQTGGELGMQTLEKALANLVAAGEISMAEAPAKASKPAELERLVGDP